MFTVYSENTSSSEEFRNWQLRFSALPKYLGFSKWFNSNEWVLTAYTEGILTSEWRHWRGSGVFTVNFEQTLFIALLFPQPTWNK